MVRGNNVEILTLAENAAFVYWVTGEEKFARFAADIFNTWLIGIYDHYFPPPFQKPLWCARIRMDTGKETGRNPGRPAAHQNANH